MNQKGFALVLIILAVVIATSLIGVGYYLGRSNLNLLTKPTPSPAAPENILCTQDAKQCPDGSYVGRTGPKCEFASCLGEKDETVNWKTYTSPGNTFSFRYPSEMTVTITDSGSILIRVEPEDLSTSESGLPTVADDPGDNRIILFHYGSLNGKVLKDLVTEEYNKGKSGADDKEVSSVILNGMNGYEYVIGGFMQNHVIYLQDKDTNYIFISTSTSPDSIAKAKKILSTFKSLP